MSNKSFFRPEFKLLNKNVTFCPRPKQPNKKSLNKDFFCFYRNVQLNAQFGPSKQNKNQLKLKSNSNRMPDELHLKTTFKTQNFYILLSFFKIAIALLIAFSIYYYMIKYPAKQKRSLPFRVTNNEFKQVLY